MTTRENRVVTSLETKGAENVKQDFEAVARAAKSFGDGTDDAGERIERSFHNIENSFDRVEKKLEAGKNITTRDIGAMGYAFETLKADIDASFGSLEKAPTEIQKAFAKAEVQVERTKDKVRLYKEAQKDLSAELDIGGQKFTSFIDLLGNRVGPGFERAAGQMGAVAAALTASWMAGTQFAAMIGTDQQAFDKFKEDFKAGGADVQRTVIDWITGTGAFGKVINDLGPQFKLSKESMEGFNAVVAAGIPVAEALRTPEADLLEIHRLHALALQGGAESMRLYNEKQAEAKGNLPAFIKSLQDAEPELKKHRDEIKANADEYNSLSEMIRRVVGDNTALQDAYRKEAEALEKKRKDGLDAADAMAKEIEKIKEYIAQGPSALAMQQNWAESLGRTAAATNLLDENQKKQIATILEQASKTGGLTAAQVALIEQTIKAAEKTNALKESLDKVPASVEAARKATNDEVFAKAMAEGFGTASKAVDDLNNKLSKDLPAAVSVAEQAMKRLAEMGTTAAGVKAAAAKEAADDATGFGDTTGMG